MNQLLNMKKTTYQVHLIKINEKLILGIEGDINNPSEIVTIKYELSYGNKKYNIEVSNSTDINES